MTALLARLRAAMDETDFWATFKTDWAVLDTELMPWSAKAQALLRGQYAPVATAARLSTDAALAAFTAAADRGVDVGDMTARLTNRKAQTAAYADAYRSYCWDVETLNDYRIAPFHILASEGAVHMDKSHRWHMETLASLAATGEPVVMATQWREIDLVDQHACSDAIDWWLNHTANSGEGVVVKPMNFICRGHKGLVQPALKSRGKVYLRIIYGPEYDSPEHLQRLRKRGLGRKRSLATREFTLGHEALHRFVDREPLRRVHECVFGILALESEPVDPRL